MKKTQKNISSLGKVELKRRKASLIKLGIMLVFSVIVFIFSSVAWFSSNTDVTGNGMGVQVICDNSFDINFRAFKYDMNEGSSSEILDYDISNNTGLLLGEYDTIFKDRNQYAGILLRLDIDGDFTDKTPYLRIYRRNRHENSNLNYVSEVARFQIANENSCQLNSYIDTSTFWNAAQSYFSAQNAPDAVLFLSGADHIDMPFTASASGAHTVLWLLVEYDDRLVRSLVNNQTMSLNQLITVDPDCTIIQLIT